MEILPDADHQRPQGLDDTTVRGLGTLSDALEKVEQVRGHFYALHQLVGAADFELDEAVKQFREAGHHDVADRIQHELIGRNIIEGRWTFQIVEEFDDGYYSTFRSVEHDVRHELAGGRRHIYEAELKAKRITPGQPGHELTP